MKVDVLLGLQWGDEGKGKIVDVLTPKYDVISRFQGGPNAGHTLEINNFKQVLHTIPRLASSCSPFAVPAELDALIGRCLEKDPAARPRSIAEVASALDGLLVHKPWTRTQIDAWWKQNWVSEGDPGRRFTAPT